MASFLGLDVGTSSVKALLIDAAQGVAAVASAPLEVSRPHPLWSEQDPEDWWQATLVAIAAVRAAAPEAWVALAGIGLSGQMHGATLLDGAGRVLRPAILWNDGRSGAECAELHRLVPDLTARAGNIAMPGFTAPKLLWVRRHEPEVFARHAARAAAEGLCTVPPDRRDGLRDVGRRGNPVAQRRRKGLGRAAARRLRARSAPYAGAGRGLRGFGDACPGIGRGMGRERGAGRWRGRGQRRLGGRASARSGPARGSCRSAPRASCSR